MAKRERGKLKSLVSTLTTETLTCPHCPKPNTRVKATTTPNTQQSGEQTAPNSRPSKNNCLHKPLPKPKNHLQQKRPHLLSGWPKKVQTLYLPLKWSKPKKFKGLQKPPQRVHQSPPPLLRPPRGRVRRPGRCCRAQGRWRRCPARASRACSPQG